jgi:hypothetical protein
VSGPLTDFGDEVVRVRRVTDTRKGAVVVDLTFEVMATLVTLDVQAIFVLVDVVLASIETREPGVGVHDVTGLEFFQLGFDETHDTLQCCFQTRMAIRLAKTRARAMVRAESLAPAQETYHTVTG